MSRYPGIIALLAGAGLAMGFVGKLSVVRFISYGHRKPMMIDYIVKPGAGDGPNLGKYRQPGYIMYFGSDGSVVYEYKENRPRAAVLPHFRFIDFPRELQRVSVDSQANMINFQALPPDVGQMDLRPVSFFDSAASCQNEMKVLFRAGEDMRCERANTPFLGYSVWRATVALARHRQTME